MGIEGALLGLWLDLPRGTIEKVPDELKVVHVNYNLGTTPQGEIDDLQLPACVTAFDLAADGENFTVLAPRHLVKPVKKRRKSGQRVPRQPIVTVPISDLLEDAIFVQNCKRKLSSTTGLVTCIGPYIEITKHEDMLKLNLVAGVYLHRNAGPYSSGLLATEVVQALLARVLNDQTIVNPLPYEATPADLFEALTRETHLSAAQITPPGVLTPLLPFQCESVRWALRREGKDIDSDGVVKDLDPQIRDYVVSPPLGWRQVPGHKLWINPYRIWVSDREPTAEPSAHEFCGKGLLAEEMGLGKTLEMIALMLLNPRPTSDDLQAIDPLTDLTVLKIRATLVIVPPAILSQWQNELASHSPDLKVLVYRGKIFDGPPVSAKDLSLYDVVLVSYTVVSTEVHSALFNPGQRNTRFWRDRTDIEQVRSPLVQVQFWRVILDEVQMIHTGVSNAARVARIVPRVHAWGVTGTPVNASMSDLRGILLFLDMAPFVEKECWRRMLASPLDFERTMSTIAIRHTKPMVADQLSLPPQTRRLISLTFSEIERHNYDQLYLNFSEEYEKNAGSLGTWLIKLRQACSHVHGSGHRDNNIVLTVDQVLTRLVDEAEATLATKVRNRMSAQLELGQYLDKAQKLDSALALWQSVATELENSLSELTTKLKRLEADYDVRNELAENLESQAEDLQTRLDEALITMSQEKLETGETEVDLRMIELKASDARLAATAASNRVKAAKSRMRSMQEMLHRTYFFMGTGFFRLTERAGDDITEETRQANSEKETLYYEKADELRSELLKEAANLVDAMRAKVQDKLIMNDVDLAFDTRQTVYLDLQAKFINEIHEQMLAILLTPLLDTDNDESEIEAYTKSFDVQEKAYVSMDMLQLLIKDRIMAVRGGRPPIVKTTPNDDWSHFRVVLMERRESLQKSCWGMDPFSASIKHYRSTGYGEKMREAFESLKEEIQTWQREINALSDLFNTRLEYYKQLQSLSDRVVDPDIGDSDLKKLVSDRRAAVYRAEKTQAHFESKLRYVRQLEVQQPVAKLEEEKTGLETQTLVDENCVICQEPIVLGSLTVCGHKFCTSCITRWYELRNECPLCKHYLGPNDMIRFRTSEAESSRPEIRDLSNKLYTQIPISMFNKILQMPIERSYGTKIDMITRHAQYLRQEDPTAQIVIFSQWAPMLRALGISLHENGLATATIAEGASEFRTNTRIACFLLHAKSDAAGLTLVNATHVFLCEPLLNTALELQAISRVHRIGQTNPTTVWLFSVESTVEQAILSLTCSRRVQQIEELQARDRDTQEHSKDTAETEILASSTGKLVDRSSGSEVVLDADMRKVLFYDFGNHKAPSIEPVKEENSSQAS